ncbi:hypothetical protein QYE76_039914 [Lolium multiflorum]|uniref:Reverse transcriptase domain-containing protein n=1 Tax=Lolium multiflorum TaxID=4521 RepID=A0AAD8WUF5_LOLMU|nr:hypothetical protein QYE76_039914 [Lolium multiflorum]
MEELTPESRALYELLKADTAEEYEKRFLHYKKEVLDAFHPFVVDTRAQLKSVDSGMASLSSDLQGVKAQFGQDLDAVRTTLTTEVANLTAAIAGIQRPDLSAGARDPSSSRIRDLEEATAGPDGRRWTHNSRGTALGTTLPPPGGGTNFSQFDRGSNSLLCDNSTGTDTGHGPRADLPQFDGTNPKLWQRRCEDYFQRWRTPTQSWTSLASDRFTGAAATWLEAHLHQHRQPAWTEFVTAVMARFCRNQHAILVRRLIHISQTSTVEDYVTRYSELMDQLSAYESNPDPVHYTTKFLDGLQPGVRILVAIQQPRDLETAYSLALLYEELGTECGPTMDLPLPVQPYVPSRRNHPPAVAPITPPSPPSRWVSPKLEENRRAEQFKGRAEDRWQSLRAYRRSKNLCFTCGEKNHKEHQCKNNIQLHVVQEMIDYMQFSEEAGEERFADANASFQPDSPPPDPHLMLLSTAAVNPTVTAPKTMKLQVTIQGKKFLFLVDSGSSSCFIDTEKARTLTGITQLQDPVRVKVAGGGILHSTFQIVQLGWSAAGAQFQDDFKLLDLGSYDGIVGLDWLAKYSPMVTHWEQGWIAIPHSGRLVVLQGEDQDAWVDAMLELHLVHEAVEKEQTIIPSEVQRLLDRFVDVFAAPSGLPPRRRYDHSIPLIPGARPVSMRPYRIAPDLKTELERQVQELLDQGVIVHSTSAFGSPVILVKKGDKTWRLVIDYRHLNALTVKGKYPLPVIDELLDELAGARWFSKLDLRAGYHQIRLAPGEEHKTAFQTHNGHYEFKVMAFGLTGAPATFQHAMNDSLAPVLRKFALVFFDDILIYSPTFELHLEHLSTVLSILQRDKWHVKLSKCAFAQQKVNYLGHVVSSEGVSTDESKIQSVRSWPTPVNLKELRGFLGLTGYYRKFIRHYAVISRPLTALLKKGVLFIWTEVEETAFLALKTAMITAPVLAVPDFKLQFVVDTDACDVGIGAVLSQQGHPVAYVSRALGPRNRGLSVYEKEYLAIILAVQHWRLYLQVGEFVIRTDHKSLAHLTDQRLHTDWQQKLLTKLMGFQYKIMYKKGVLNGAADALSRKPPDSSQAFAITTVQPQWLSTVLDSYSRDAQAQALLQKLSVDPNADARYTLDHGVLRCNGRIWVGDDAALQQQIISAFHDSPQGGHSGFPVTYRHLVSLFAWPAMKKMVQSFVRSCRTCQQAKPERLPPAGLLQPLPIPSEPWETATMDFIEGLPQSRQFNCILVVVDKLTKYAHFIPLRHPYTASKIPVAVLGRRVRQVGFRTVPQALIHWSGMPEDQATWEDVESLRQQFPAAPAWGQAGFQARGIVNDQAPPGTSNDDPGMAGPSQAKEGRPTRKKKTPDWLASGDWVQ